MNNDNNIHDLNEDPENEFEVPKGYFESFNTRLMSRIQMEKELKEFTHLSSIEKRNCFLVPGDYFETRDFEAACKNNESGIKEGTVIALSHYIRRRGLSIAAILIIVLGVALFLKVYNKSSEKTVDCTELACLTKDDITNSNYFDQISMDEIESVANGEMLDSLGTEINKEALKELMADPEAINITDEDLGI